MTTPDPGERVLLFNQSDYELLRQLDGQPPSAADTVVDKTFYSPRWVQFDKQFHPGWGRGLLVVREGKLTRGPAEWDSSG